MNGFYDSKSKYQEHEVTPIDRIMGQLVQLEMRYTANGGQGCEILKVVVVVRKEKK